MSSWTQLGLAIGDRVHLAPKKRKPLRAKPASKSKPVRKKPPKIDPIDLDDLNDSVDDLYV